MPPHVTPQSNVDIPRVSCLGPFHPGCRLSREAHLSSVTRSDRDFLPSATKHDEQHHFAGTFRLEPAMNPGGPDELYEFAHIAPV
jgi:hypothetical protein